MRKHVTEAEAAKALGIKHKVCLDIPTQELQKKADRRESIPTCIWYR
ncbi:MAG: hypothetical protein ACLUD0_19270 [Eubacterium ramulus]